MVSILDGATRIQTSLAGLQRRAAADARGDGILASIMVPVKVGLFLIEISRSFKVVCLAAAGLQWIFPVMSAELDMPGLWVYFGILVGLIRHTH